jgi:hypothetical protein
MMLQTDSPETVLVDSLVRHMRKHAHLHVQQPAAVQRKHWKLAYFKLRFMCKNRS